MRSAATTALLLAIVAAPHGQPASLPSAVAERVVADNRVMQYVRGVTTSGPRLTGTDGHRRAAEWAVAQLRASGLANVGVESFTIPDGWERVSASARVVAPEDRPLRVAALGWTPSTRAGGVEADVVAVNDLAPEAIALLTTLAGRIALLPAGDVGGNPATAVARRRALDTALARAGAVAILAPETERDNSLPAHDRTFGATTSALPVAQIGRDDAAAIRRMLAGGRVRISLELRNRVTPGPIAVDNVIAEIRGSDRPDEWVLVGAHLDSWDFSESAQDNATGVAMVIDAARVIAALSHPPRRSIRFALWAGEEQGQLGSNAYVSAHRAELDRCIAYLNSDAGSGRLIGWTAPGRRDVAESARHLLEPLAAEPRIAFDTGMQYAFQSDGAAFVRAGIAMLDLNADDSAYEDIHHKPADTIDRVDARNVLSASAVVAATAYAVADAAAPLAPRRQVDGQPKMGHAPVIAACAQVPETRCRLSGSNVHRTRGWTSFATSETRTCCGRGASLSPKADLSSSA